MSNRLQDRIALVTGASRGIGRAVALAFAREGAHVLALARTVGALEELDDEIAAVGGSATLIPLDLTDGEKTDALGPMLYERWGKLDVFVGNAGMLGPLSPLSHVVDKEWNAVMALNVDANRRLLRTLDPLLQRSDAGRVILVTSGVAQRPRAYWGPYQISKAAVEALMKTYAAEVASTNVRANAINPGATATAMRRQAYPGEERDTLTTPEEVAGLFVELASPDEMRSGDVIDFKA